MKIWPFVLGAWLIITGIDDILYLSFQYEHTIMAVFAIVAGALVALRV